MIGTYCVDLHYVDDEGEFFIVDEWLTDRDVYTAMFCSRGIHAEYLCEPYSHKYFHIPMVF